MDLFKYFINGLKKKKKKVSLGKFLSNIKLKDLYFILYILFKA